MYHGIVFNDTVAYRFFPKDHTSFIMLDGCCSLNQQLFSLLFTPYYTDERTQALFAAHYSNPSLKTEFSVASWAFLLSSSLMWYRSTLQWMHLFIQDPCENEILLALFYRFTDKIPLFQSEAPMARFFQCSQLYLFKEEFRSYWAQLQLEYSAFQEIRLQSMKPDTQNKKHREFLSA